VRIYFGTYPSTLAGQEPEGIWHGTFNTSDGSITNLAQVAVVSAPSFITVDGRGSLFAVSEGEHGALSQYAISDDHSLELVGRVPTQGIDPCHVITLPGLVVATNYTSGSVFAHVPPLPQDAEGHQDSGELFQQFGTGPVLDRQEGPHAHFAAQLPGTQFLWVTDLGADKVFKYQLAAGGNGRTLLSFGAAVNLPAGTGPRHIAFGPDNIAYIVGELDPRIYAVRFDTSSGDGEVIGSAPVGTPVEGKIQQPSHIEISADGTRLFTAVRGADTLSTHALDGLGGLTLLGETSVGGQWPRHFRALGRGEGELADRELVLVANQGSATLDTLALDPATGEGTVVASTPLQVAACVLPLD